MYYTIKVAIFICDCDMLYLLLSAELVSDSIPVCDWILENQSLCHAESS